ncbi:uncharacterized protein LOC141815193 [Curcuma longa]|uniref:uncharacterized protein LOC141815193 n=1 Tax=Curcuma longa TaxID=136217 RepID=UPI003D9F79AC
MPIRNKVFSAPSPTASLLRLLPFYSAWSLSSPAGIPLCSSLISGCSLSSDDLLTQPSPATGVRLSRTLLRRCSPATGVCLSRTLLRRCSPATGVRLSRTLLRRCSPATGVRLSRTLLRRCSPATGVPLSRTLLRRCSSPTQFEAILFFCWRQLEMFFCWRQLEMCNEISTLKASYS